MEHKDHRKRGKKSQVGPLKDKQETESHGNTSFDLDFMSDNTPQNNNKVMNTFRETVNATKHKNNAITAIVDAKRSASKWRSYTVTKRVRPTKKLDVSGGIIRKKNIFSNAISLLKKKLRHKDTVHTDKTDGSVPVRSQNQESEERPRTGGIGLDDVHTDYVASNSVNVFGGKTDSQKKGMSAAGNRSLIDYFAKLGRSTDVTEVIDLEFVETLLKSGANINCTDKHGQGLLHEVARTWHVDVAKFLISEGAEVNLQDNFGRSPLHVAAAVDYPEMVEVLIEMGADKECETYKEKQTPLHYAAKNDACQSLKTLFEHKCEYNDVVDYKGRTPLQLAAELDRSESARFLLEKNAIVGVSDKEGNKALSWMISKMPPVAHDALDQLHSTDRPNRNQYYYLQLMVQDRKMDPKGHAQSPLQVAVAHRQYDLLTHRVFTKLITLMWERFARWRAWMNIFVNFLHIILWTILGVVIEYDKRYTYSLPDHWWRIVLSIAAVACTMWQVAEEINEYRRSVRNHNIWKDRRTNGIEADKKFCHPRWPEEESFLNSELEDLDKSYPKYFSDFWNIFDWICYIFLLVVIITHIVDIVHHSETVARLHINIMAITIIIIWLRLLKCARSFSLIGPFIVIISHMVIDLVRFALLYIAFYLPYVCAFWMCFGGSKVKYSERNLPPEARAENITVAGYGQFNEVMFTLFRMTLVDEYSYEGMKEIDPVMTDILVGTWLALSAIVALNLFIALLSDTFQRVYDNAQANAIMQKAITCLSFWEGMSVNSRKTFLDFIEKDCSPLKEYYDDDMTDGGEEDMKKVTIQIKEDLDDFREKWQAKFGRSSKSQPQIKDSNSENQDGEFVSAEKFDSEVGILKEGIKELQVRQDDMMDKFNHELNVIKNMLIQMAGGGDDDYGNVPDLPAMDVGQDVLPDSDHRRSRSKDKRKKKKKRAASGSGAVGLEPTPQSLAGGRHVDVSVPDFPTLQTQVPPHSFPGQDPSSEA